MVLPVTPPPEFDLPAWLDSIERILAWAPARLFLTHFGLSPDPVGHFAALGDGLRDWTGFAQRALAGPGSENERMRRFVAELERWIGDRADPAQARTLLDSAGAEACWQGIVRYLRTTG
jgi:hypothetical protein